MIKPTIALPNARSNEEGFARLARLYADVAAHPASEIDLDASGVRWIDANLAAPIIAAVRLLDAKHGKKVGIRNLAPNVREIFISNGLLKSEYKKQKSTVIPLKRFDPGQGKDFAQYTSSYFANKGMPPMSDALKSGFFEGIDEIFQNSEIHSKTRFGIYACGQWFPKWKRLDFSMVDLGIGFSEVISRGIGRPMPAEVAIVWAMTGRNTTRKLDVPGGLGLKILKDFVRLNGGRLSIVSHSGYWCMERGGVTMSSMVAPFPGTVVTLEINTADTAAYKMSDEVDPASLF